MCSPCLVFIVYLWIPAVIVGILLNILYGSGKVKSVEVCPSYLNPGRAGPIRKVISPNLYATIPKPLLISTLYEYFVFLLYCILFIIILCFSPAAGLLQQTNFSNGRINKVVSNKHKRP